MACSFGIAAPSAQASSLDPLDQVVGQTIKDLSGVFDYWTPGRMASALPRMAPPPTAASFTPILDADRVGLRLRVPGQKPTAPRRSSGGGSGSGGPTLLRSSEGSQGARSQNRAVNRIEVSPPSNTTYPHTTHGKIFGHMKDVGNYVCSGTVVNSNNRSVIATAAHCVYDATAGFAKNLIFVPAYYEGDEPYGRFAAKKIKIHKVYKRNQLVTYDFAMAQMEPDPENTPIDPDTGEPYLLEEVVGSRGAAFNEPRDQLVDAYGYPAEGKPIFDGQRMFDCRSVYRGDDGNTSQLKGPTTMRIDCDMTGGSSGGGWIIRQNGATVAGYIYSNISYQYASSPNRLYGPYYSLPAYNTWIDIQTSCKGQRATIQGTEGDDVITGSPDDDVIVAFGGDDEIRGLGGNDVVCGGPGRDIIFGDSGSDLLRGEGGNDKVVGRYGFDRCNGGSGSDRKRSCEKSKNF